MGRTRILFRLAGALACVHFTLALALTPEWQAVELAVSQAPRDVLARAEAALAQADHARDADRQLKALRTLAQAQSKLEDTAGLDATLKRAIPLAEAAGDVSALAELRREMGDLQASGGRYADAERTLAEVIVYAQARALDPEVARALSSQASVALLQGKSSEAMELNMRAYRMFESQQDKLWMATTLAAVGDLYLEESGPLHDPGKGIEYGERAVKLLDPTANKFDLATLYHNLGLNYFRNKNYAKAGQYFERGIALARELRDAVGVAYFDYRLARLASEQGHYPEALRSLDRAAPVFEQSGNAVMRFVAELSRGEVLAHLAQRKESLASLAQARRLFKAADAPEREVELHETAAKIHATLGDFDKAYEEMRLLREADKRKVAASDAKRAEEAKMRFDVQLKDAENALLRSREQLAEARLKEADARRWGLLLFLALSLVLLAGLGLFVWRQSRQKRRFASLALRDELTGAPNRRAIMEFARLEFEARLLMGRQFCLAMIDLDHFKTINDSLGHAVGDEVLRAFFRAAAEVLRANDRIGRYGGEEFMLVMPGSDASVIPAVFMRLREGLEKTEVAGLPGEWKVRFSLGAAESRNDTDTLDALIRRADQALYEAKRGGRDSFRVGPKE